MLAGPMIPHIEHDPWFLSEGPSPRLVAEEEEDEYEDEDEEGEYEDDEEGGEDEDAFHRGPPKWR